MEADTLRYCYVLMAIRRCFLCCSMLLPAELIVRMKLHGKLSVKNVAPSVARKKLADFE